MVKNESIRPFLIARVVIIACVTVLVCIGFIAVLFQFKPEEEPEAVNLPLKEFKEIIASDFLKTNRLRKVSNLPLAQKEPQEVSVKRMEELVKEWDAFKHEPYDTGGVNHLTLPFHFVNDNGEVNQREGFAFSFLLSSALDWIPGNYCSRHSYFVNKRDRERMLSASIRYDHNLIKPLIDSWGSTHAIGGQIVKNNGGYSGTLRVYDKAGMLVHEEFFAKSREYFELLGDMSVDCMQFLGYETSDALSEHLHAKRCNHHESIVDLGSAAFMEYRSPELFRQFRLILERDPDFGEVRYWSANQAYWVHKNRADYEKQLGLSLRSYITVLALSDFHPEYCLDKDLLKEHPEWVNEAELLIGKDNPNLVLLRMDQDYLKNEIDVDSFHLMSVEYAKYPNYYDYCIPLLQFLRDREFGLADDDMLASISLTILNSRYKPSSFTATSFMLSPLVDAMMNMGHNDIASQLLVPYIQRLFLEGDVDYVYAKVAILGTALRNMGYYEEAYNLYMFAYKHRNKKDRRFRKNQLLSAGVCAAMMGREDMVIKTIELCGKNGTAGAIHGAYLDLLHGKTINTNIVVRGIVPGFYFEANSRELIFLQAQADIMRGQSRMRKRLIEHLEHRPFDKEFWVLFDAYDRMDPEPESRSFYESIRWLRGDDPWVRKAYKDYKARMMRKQAVDPDALCEILSEYEPLRWPTATCDHECRKVSLLDEIQPGDVAVAVRKLLADNNKDKAKDLVLRYGHYASHSEHVMAIAAKGFHLRSYCNHLYHKIEDE